MLIQGGINKQLDFIPDFYLLDLDTNKWHKVGVIGNETNFLPRECRSCSVSKDNICYFFGGENKKGKHNDLFKVTITYSQDKGFQSNWILESPVTQKPPERSSHSCVIYEPDLLIITGGEGKEIGKLFISNIFLLLFFKMASLRPLMTLGYILFQIDLIMN